MSERLALPDFLAEAAKTAELSGLGNKKVDWWFRAVHPDLRSKNGFRYPWPGQWAEAPGPIIEHDSPCPQAEGDGLCVAKTFYGASQGGIPFGTFLLVVGAKREVLAEDDHKIRARRMYFADVISLATILSRADLSGAYLSGAYLSEANLSGAYLSRADLSWADLSRADLSRANLSRADLSRANLSEANLSEANLSEAEASQWTLWPAGFHAKKAGVVVR